MLDRQVDVMVRFLQAMKNGAHVSGDTVCSPNSTFELTLLCYVLSFFCIRAGEAPMDRNLLRHISSICNQLPAMTSQNFDAAFLQVRLDFQLSFSSSSSRSRALIA